MTNVLVKFDGQYLTILEDGVVVLSIPAISGKLGYQSPTQSNLADTGTLPQGTYTIKPSEQYQNINDISKWNYFKGNIGGGTWPGLEGSWGTERIWIEPNEGTETYGRGGFSIHGGTSPGSAGCIDLVDLDSLFFGIIRSYNQDVTLEVNYGSYDGSTHPFYGEITEYKASPISDINNITAQSGVDFNELLGIEGNEYLAARQFIADGVEYILTTADDILHLPEISAIFGINPLLRGAVSLFDQAKNFILMRSDPILLDMDSDGLELTSVVGSNVRFDINNNGIPVTTGWVSPDDALLAMDDNGNGTIDNLNELFGNNSIAGFAELATLDSNLDGKISNLDAQFNNIKVWQDLNQNGISEAGELWYSLLTCESCNDNKQVQFKMVA